MISTRNVIRGEFDEVGHQEFSCFLWQAPLSAFVAHSAVASQGLGISWWHMLHSKWYGYDDFVAFPSLAALQANGQVIMFANVCARRQHSCCVQQPEPMRLVCTRGKKRLWTLFEAQSSQSQMSQAAQMMKRLCPCQCDTHAKLGTVGQTSKAVGGLPHMLQTQSRHSLNHGSRWISSP